MAGSGCTKTATSTSRGPGRVPPAPSLSARPQGSNQPPEVWVGGTLTDVAPDHLKLRDASGAVLTLQRLAEGATVFFRASGGVWRQLDPLAPISRGQAVCVDTVMAGSNLLALRVFLGAACGPE